MSVNVLQPWVLILLPLLLPIFFFLGRPRMARLPRWLRRSALGTRLAIVTLIVLSLSQPLRDAKDIVVRDPGGKSVVFPITAAGKGKAVPYSSTELVGRYAVAQRGEKGPLSQSWFTVNAGEESHSDIRPRTFPIQLATGPLGDLASAINRELWPYLAALGLGVLSLEWLVYVRR